MFAKFRILLVIGTLCCVTPALSQERYLNSTAERLLPRQWTLRPAGTSIPLGDKPLNIAISPDNRYIAILHSGYGQHEIRVVDLKSHQQVGQASLKNTWYGVAFTPDGKRLYVSAGTDDAVVQYDFNHGILTNPTRFDLTKDTTTLLYPCGIAIDKKGQFAYIAEQYGNRLVALDLLAPEHSMKEIIKFSDSHSYPYKVVLHPDGITYYVSLWGGKAVAEGNVANAKTQLIFTDSHPNEMVLTKDGSRLFVACANSNNVDIIDTKSHRVTEKLNGALYPNMPEGSTPNGLALSADEKTLYVVNADNDDLAVFDISRPGHAKSLGFIPTGWYPTVVAVSPNKEIIVVNGKGNGSLPNPDGPKPVSQNTPGISIEIQPSGQDAQGLIFKVNKKDYTNAKRIGVLPKLRKWEDKDAPDRFYESSMGSEVRITQDDHVLYPVKKVVKGKASLDKDTFILHYYRPKGDYKDWTLWTWAAPANSEQYIGGLLLGTLSFIPQPSAIKLKAYTRQAYLCSPLRQDLLPVHAEKNNPIPAKVGDPSPIKYVVYFIKENRTYDQMFGDMPQGNGDSTLCLFGENVTPNLHKIVRDFVLLDNLYADAEISATGHEWSMGAYATDFVEKSWPPNYGGHDHPGKTLDYKSEGADPVDDGDAGHIWNRAKEAGITYRSYGEWVDDGGPAGKGHTSDPVLMGHFDPFYTGWNLDTSDLDRFKQFQQEFMEFEKKGEMPQLVIIKLPNDHTSGTAKGEPTPTAYQAQNDLALGMFLDLLSHSQFWKNMAVFAIEDDAQSGSDHVDAHRTEGIIAGPFVKRGYVDHHLYSTTSFLRTMELILGLKPMSQFDAAALPLYTSFTNVPNNQPYVKEEARVSLTEINEDKAPMQKQSSLLNFKKEDANPDILFNEIIWKSVKGANSEMSPPVHAAFIQPAPKLADKDED